MSATLDLWNESKKMVANIENDLLDSLMSKKLSSIKRTKNKLSKLIAQLKLLSGSIGILHTEESKKKQLRNSSNPIRTIDDLISSTNMPL